jgi:hypothetical protein
MRFFTSSIKPICANCVYARLRQIDMVYSCTKIYDINLVTGNKIYVDAYECIKSETLCGINGKYYKEIYPKQK